MIFVDPALPLGLIVPRLRAAPVVVVLHGAEITVPGRLPSKPLLGARAALGRRRGGGRRVPARARACTRPVEPLPSLVVPPGVDVERFRPPADAAERAAARDALGLPGDMRIVLGASRLVPRKGFDVLIDAHRDCSRTT